MAGYVTAVLAFVRAEHHGQGQAVSVTSCDFTPFYSFLTQPNIFFFEMCLVRSTIIAKLCPDMFHFDALDFSVALKNW